MVAVQSWHENWYEGQCDDLGTSAIKKCAVPIKSRYSFTAQPQN